MLSRLRREKKGFTLIELIMVIIILGIIAGVAIPKFLSVKTSAQEGVVRGVHAALLGTIAQLQAKYLLGEIASYDATAVVNNTTVQGIILSAPTATTINAIVRGTTYSWTFTAGSGNAQATIDLVSPVGSLASEL